MVHRTAFILLGALLLTGIGLGATAEESDDALDWSAWEQMPVFRDGRIMPMDTLARSSAEKMCGRANPTLELRKALPDVDWSSPAMDGAKTLFPDDRQRKFTATELIFSWMIEPEKWEQVPFLKAEHEAIRAKVEVPTHNSASKRLKYVSPHQMEQARALQTQYTEIQLRRRAIVSRGEKFKPTGIDEKVWELYGAYELFRMIGVNDSWLDNSSSRFSGSFERILGAQTKLRRDKRRFDELAPALDFMRPVEIALRNTLSAQAALDRTRENQEGSAQHGRSLPPNSRRKALQPRIQSLAESAALLAEQLAQLRDNPPELPADIKGKTRQKIRDGIAALAADATLLTRHARESWAALYDHGVGSLALVPGLSPVALEDLRVLEDETPPWISLEMLLHAPDELLYVYLDSKARERAIEELSPMRDEIREAFDEVKEAYLMASDSPKRAKKFSEATVRFAAAVQKLGRAIEPYRQKLRIVDRNDDLLVASAYPAAEATEREIYYNQLDPFFWSWVVSFAAAICFGLVFGVIRRGMFWSGMILLGVGLYYGTFGLMLRYKITDWVPVTNMFETVVFVAITVAAMGMWFALVPLTWPGMKVAWRFTAAPFTWEQTPLEKKQASLVEPAAWDTAGWVLLVVRAGFTCWVFLKLAWTGYGSSEHSLFALMPRADVGTQSISANDWLTWLVGMAVLIPSLWYLPRAMVSAALALVTIPWTLYCGLADRPLEHVYRRKAIVFSAALIAFGASVLGYFAPVFDKEIGTIQPILRSNLWLLIHVLTITASYGAGALAWGLGNIALAYYLFGRYRRPLTPSAETLAKGHRPATDRAIPAGALSNRPPENCATLAKFIYRAVQVAVLLLVGGTILGGLWADVSWGRFWGWDNKEVWALISSLVYLAILHGRYAGWFGNFGLTVGTVVGFTAIVMAWYGVNYVLPGGLHSYGAGTGGQLQVAITAGINWMFVAAAIVRYQLETRRPPKKAIEATAPA